MMQKKNANVKKRRIIWAVILAVCVTMIIINILYNMPPKTYRSVEGPSTDDIQTSGVFKPGGYVEITFSPEIESIKGYNKGTVRVYPLHPGYAYITDTIWNEDKANHFGKDWPGSMSGSGSSMKTFKIVHRVDIPNDENLAGEKIVLYCDYSIFYPVYAGAAPGVNTSYFRDDNISLDAKITISLDDVTLTDEELEWMDKKYGQVYRVLQFLAGVFFSLVFLLFIKY